MINVKGYKNVLDNYIELDNLKVKYLTTPQDYEAIYAQASPSCLGLLQGLCWSVQEDGRSMMHISLTINGKPRQLLHLWNTYEVYDFQCAGRGHFLDIVEEGVEDDEDLDWFDPWILLLQHYVWNELGDTPDADYYYVNVGDLDDFILPEPLGWEEEFDEIVYDEERGRFIHLE